MSQSAVRPEPAGRKSSGKKDPYYLRAVGKAVEAQEILKRSPAPLTLSEMASRLNLTKSSALRILHTLEVSRYLQRTGDGRYATCDNGASRVSAQFVERLIEAADGPLRQLVREFRETVGLGVLFDNHIEVVSVVESPELIRMGNTLGRIVPPHASALGKCVAAFQREDRRERLLRSYGIVRITQNTIVDELRLKQEFERIVSLGYSTDDQESALHAVCFGAPITAPDGEVIAAISISPPLSRLPEQGRENLVAGIARTARTISEALQS
ncbi:MAG: IclR family transcriptional regulator [Acidobacteria bacterium]|nr:IclR family transcriptional regulator [Acidobacteriota bacterium]